MLLSEYLLINEDWEINAQYHNNNGLLILKK